MSDLDESIERMFELGSRVMLDPRVRMKLRLPRHGGVQLVGFRAHGMLVEAWDGVQTLTFPTRFFISEAVDSVEVPR